MNYKLLIFLSFSYFQFLSFSQTSSHLINIDEFKQLDTSSYSLIDLRKPTDFNQGHIKNAINLWRTQIVDSNLVFGGMKVSRDTLKSLFGKVGIKSTDKLIIYDAKGDVDAARLWWILYAYGHKDVSLLNGGLTEWENKKNKVTRLTLYKEVSNYQFPNREDYSLTITKPEIIKALKDSNTIIIDTRTIDEYLGKTLKEGAYRKGRIPSSVFIDWCEAINYNGDRKFKAIEELNSIYNLKSIAKNHPIITYCQSGVRSAHTTFVLTQLLGFTNVKNYDGSWIEWSYNKNLPLETSEPINLSESENNSSVLSWLFILCPILLLLLAIFLVYKKK